MKANKKKIIVLISLVALLVATGLLNYFLNVNTIPNDNNDNTEATPTFFVSYRTDRETTRAEEILYLDGIIQSETADEETIATAQNKKLAICDAMETEMVLEGLIKSKGFEDCVVTISTENVKIVVQDEKLSLEKSSKILNIVVTETAFTAPDVVIVPYV